MINDIYLTGFSGQIGTELRKVFFKKNIGITLLGEKNHLSIKMRDLSSLI